MSSLELGTMNSQFSDAAIALAHRSALRSIDRVVEETIEPTPPAHALARITVQLEHAQPQGGLMVITGAGVSTDSGIPDYRGPSGSLSRHRPMTYQEFLHSPAASHRYWARSFVGWQMMDQAEPNRTHYALVELERAGYVRGVVTQNVDGLHAQAGQSNVVPLHGDLAIVMCLNCGYKEDRRAFDRRLTQANPGYIESLQVRADMVNPDGDVSLSDQAIADFRMVGCLMCGSEKLKPDVVYFGEPIPTERKEAAFHILEHAPSVLVAGSSLAVMSGYRFVLEARRRNKAVAVINGGPGRADAKATTVWRTAVAPAFDMLLDQLDL